MSASVSHMASLAFKTRNSNFAIRVSNFLFIRKPGVPANSQASGQRSGGLR